MITKQQQAVTTEEALNIKYFRETDSESILYLGYSITINSGE